MCKHKEKHMNFQAFIELLDVAKRNLYKESGAIEYDIKNLGVYEVPPKC